MKNYCIVQIDSYEGDDTYLRCGSESQEYLFAVIAIDASGSASIVDNGYRSSEEAALAWPEAKAPIAISR